MKIYAGETLSGTMVLEDDNGQIINDFSEYDIIMLIRNKFDDYQVVLHKGDLDISGSEVRFAFSGLQTSQLNQIGVFELKVIKNGVIKIAKEDNICIIDNKIKNVE